MIGAPDKASDFNDNLFQIAQRFATSTTDDYHLIM